MSQRVTVVGNIGQAPTTRTTPKGEVVEFTVADTPRVRTDDGWKDGSTTWYTVSAWDRLGANAMRSLQKGQRVIVHGDSWLDRWTGQDGVPRSKMCLKAVALGHELTWGTSVYTKGGATAPAQRAVEAPAPALDQAPSGGDWGAPPPSADPSPTTWAAEAGIEYEDTPF